MAFERVISSEKQIIELDEVNESISLPFEKNKQLAMLGHLLRNDQFFTHCMDKIQPSWFVNPFAQKVYSARCEFFRQFRRCPSIEELRNLNKFMVEEQGVITNIYNVINFASIHCQEYGLDALAAELTIWMHSQIFSKAIKASARMFNSRKPTDAYHIMQAAMQEIGTTTFNDDKEERFDSYISDLEKSKEDYGNALTFGVNVFDRLLTPKAQGGSLLPGDTSVVLAPTNVGKTTSMITVICANLRRRKRVLFITHEGRPADIKEKIWCCMLGCNSNELMDKYKTPEGRKQIDIALKFINDNLTYVPMNKAGLLVEDVVAVIRKRQDSLCTRNGGKGYDLLVCDYPAKLQTSQNHSGILQKRNADEIIYNYFVQLGLEHKYHVLVAIQTNREGSKVNKKQGVDRLLTMEDVQESWGPMTSATNVWTLNRGPKDKIANRMIVHIDKSRSSEVGWSIVCRTDFRNSCTHSDKLGATFYRGESTHQDKLDQYMEQYLNAELPEAVLLE